MKKSLSTILSAALVLGTFSSMAFAADATTTTAPTAPTTAQEKFDVLKAKGIFTGINANGDAGLANMMTRAEFARVLGLLDGLDVDAQPASQVFTDVGPANWAYQEVGAANKAGLLVGVGKNKYNPNGNILVQDLAVALSQTLGLPKVDGATVVGASNYAAPYIKALENAGIVLPTNYKESASRELLVNASFAAYAVINKTTVPVVNTNAVVTLDKIAAYQQLGVSQDLSVTVTDKTNKAAIANVDVTFVIDGQQTAGNENIIKTVKTDATGKAKVSYTRAVAGADNISIYVTSNPAARATTALWWNSSAKVFDVGTLTDATQANGSSRAYSFTAYDPTTGAAMQNAVINIGFAEDMLPAFGIRSNGARINGVTIGTNVLANEKKSVKVTTDSNGRGQFTISGTDVTLSPVLFIDGNLDEILNPSEVRTFVAKTTFDSSNGLITITPVSTAAYANLNSQRVYKVKLANADGTPITNLAVNAGIKESLDATTANDPGTRIIWFDNTAAPVAIAQDNATTAGTAVTAYNGIKLPSSIYPNANGEFTFAVYNNEAPGSAKAGRVATPIVWIDTVNDGALGTGEIAKEAPALSYVAQYQGKGRLGAATGSVLSNASGSTSPVVASTETTVAYTALNEDAQPIAASALPSGTQVTFTVRNTSAKGVTITKVNGSALPTVVPVAAGAAQTVTGTFPVGSNQVTISLVGQVGVASAADVTAQITGYDNTTADKVTASWYVANVNPQTVVSHQTTASYAGVATTGIALTAKTAGTVGNSITFNLTVGASAQPLTVTAIAATKTITVNLATNATPAATSTQADVIAAINADAIAKTMVTASLPAGDTVATDVVTAVTAATTAGATDEAVTLVSNVSVNGTVVSVNTNAGDADGGSMVVLTTGGELVTLGYTTAANFKLRVLGSDVSEPTFEGKISAGDVISYTADATPVAIFNITTNN